MTVTPHRSTRPIVALTILAGTLAACGGTVTFASPSGSASPAPAVNPSSPTARPDGPSNTAPPAEPSIAVASNRPACEVAPQSGLLPSDHLIDLAISATPTHDLVTFVFAPQGPPTPAGAPRGSLEAARPPFSYAGSGQEFQLLGEHAVQVRFTGMVIADESGQATYQGSRDARPRLPSLREVVQYDASEGVVAFDIGYDGPGCVTLSRDGNEVTVAIAHPEAPAG